MDTPTIELLLVEDSAPQSQLTLHGLRQDGRFHVTCVDKLAPGLRLAGGGRMDAVLLDLWLPDSQGLDTLARLRAAAPDVPIVVLTGAGDEALATAAVRAGAQDCLAKHGLEPAVLSRSVRHAIERQRTLSSLRRQSLVDELTGLHNRRGFLHMGERQRRIALRARTGFSVLFIDVDGLKEVNDERGHAAGDALLRGCADVLRHTFRRSDVLARIGGDEFAVLTDEPIADAEEAGRVWRGRLETRAAELGRSSLAVSLGAATFEPESPRTVEELLDAADGRMYATRRRSARGRRRSSTAA